MLDILGFLLVTMDSNIAKGVCFICKENKRGLFFGEGDCCGQCFDELMKKNKCTCNPVVDSCCCIGEDGDGYTDGDNDEEEEVFDKIQYCYICNINPVAEPVRVCYYISREERCCHSCYNDIVIKIGVYESWNKFMPEKVPLRIDDFGTKGRGCVALRMFKKGDIVLVEKPFLMAFTLWELVEMFWKDYSISEIKRFAEVEFKGNGCGITRWDHIDATNANILNTKYDKTNKQLIFKLYDSFATYVVSLARNNKKMCMQGIFNHLNYINHSCLPNCEMRTIDTNTGMIMLMANRMIMPGEEITYSYVSMSTYQKLIQVAGPVAAKNAMDEHMQNMFGFTCGCPLITPVQAQCYAAFNN